MTAKTVSISRCETYEPADVAQSLQHVLEPLGGMQAYVKPGDKVLIKINLLRNAMPDRAVTTHPSVIEAVINEVKRAGGIPIVGDSPGGPNKPKQIESIVKTTEVAAVCERTGTELVIFDRETAKISYPDGKLYSSFTVGQAIRDADVIITLPKLKTHGLMKLTGAVKILFGAIPGLEKAQFHLKVPDRMDFANMLLDLYLAIKPSLSIMDGIVAMEGDGPSGGDPRNVGALIASADAVALDFVASRIIGFDPLDVYTNRAAVERGLISGMDDISIAGVPLPEVLVKDFRAPKGELLDEKLPGWLLKAIKNLSTSMPYLAVPKACSACGTCAKSCPAEAITYKDRKPQFNYDNCIRCYCCEELCPELAIKRKNHWLVRPFVRK